MNRRGFDLSLESHREFIQDRIKEVCPVLLILDPMYLIFGQLDANSMRDLQPYLKWVIQISDTYNCAVALIHHSAKVSQNTAGRRAGQRLMGSATMHGFTDSALYTTKLKDEREGWTRVGIEREFRELSDQRPLEMAWSFGDGLDMQIEVGDAKERVHVEADTSNGHVRVSRVEKQIAAIVGQREGVTVSHLAKRTGLDSRTIKRHINTGEQMELRENGPGKAHLVFLNNGGAST
jgi:hypothetical protein